MVGWLFPDWPDQGVSLAPAAAFAVLTVTAYWLGQFRFGPSVVAAGVLVLSALAALALYRGASFPTRRALAPLGARRVAWVGGAEDAPDVAEALLTGLASGAHRAWSEARDDARPPGVETVTWWTDAATAERLAGPLRRAAATHDAVAWARDLVDAPANRLTPDDLARAAEAMGREVGLDVAVYDEGWIDAHGLGALAAVGRGSVHPPRLVVLRTPEDAVPADAPTLAWVGKGVTFDSGGLSLKGRDAMPPMKGDMAGAAAVLGATRAVALERPDVRLISVVACVENMPDGAAYRPSDVVRASDGTAIEIVSTDAEGRLALADALRHAASFAPDATIDVATLTGGAVAALGRGTAAAAFGDDAGWMTQVRDAARTSGERVWPMPRFEAYRTALASRVADLKNGGVKEGSAGVAAVFLERFAPRPWVHLDVAGMGAVETPTETWNAGATGFGVRLLAEVARDVAMRGVRAEGRPMEGEEGTEVLAKGG